MPWKNSEELYKEKVNEKKKGRVTGRKIEIDEWADLSESEKDEEGRERKRNKERDIKLILNWEKEKQW